jgi:all-trans-8'-apo-beta-carotenal 15,15'-oxygenase
LLTHALCDTVHTPYHNCVNGLQLDPTTLETKGTFDFSGTLQSCYSAHPSVCPDTGAIYNLGLQLTPPFPLAAMRISPQSEAVEQTGSTKLPEMTHVHDNVLTPEYLACVTAPYVAAQSSMGVSMLGGSPISKQYRLLMLTCQPKVAAI